MKKLTFCVLIWAFLSSSALAQRSELGVFAGGAFYLGDLNPSGLFSQTQPAFGAVYRFNLTTRWALRANVLTGVVTADDAISGTPERNLHFRSRVNEFSIQAEINFLTYFTGSQNHRFSPFLFGGVGVFTFDPWTYIRNSYNNLDRNAGRIYLAQLRTEGQGAPENDDYPAFPGVYNTTQLVIPFGFGFKFSLNRTFSLGVEWGMRLTFTDYLDDVSGFYVNPGILLENTGNPNSPIMADRSLNGPQVPGTQRGNRNLRDWYSFAGITLTARIGSGPGMACPAMQQRRADQIRRHYHRMR